MDVQTVEAAAAGGALQRAPPPPPPCLVSPTTVEKLMQQTDNTQGLSPLPHSLPLPHGKGSITEAGIHSAELKKQEARARVRAKMFQADLRRPENGAGGGGEGGGGNSLFAAL